MEEPGSSDPPASGPSRRVLSRLATWVLAPAVLASLVFAQTRLFRESTCETYDEYTYLRMGICIYRDGDFKSLASPMCPPLPILLEYGLPALTTGSVPDTEPWEQETPSLFRRARLMTSLLVGVPLVLLVYAWLAGRRGWMAGALGGGLVALSPTVLAASSIATTDACFALFALVALAALHRYQVRPSRWSFAAAGAAIGLAVASKQTGIILFPVALVELLLKLPDRKPGRTRVDHGLAMLARVAGRMAALGVLAFVADWSLYGFRLGPRFGAADSHLIIPVFIPMILDLLPNGEAILDVIRQWGGPLALDTLAGQIDHASTGHQAFLMGRYSFRGWWYFFPVAIALKSTPAELAMMGVVGVLACRPANWRDPARRLWLVTIAVMLGAGMYSSINIGHRYMLLIYPLVALVVADRLGELAVGRPARAIALGASLLAWQGVSAWGIAPHYLSYFNSFCGGPTEGYRYLVDSSLDWGQDLPSLRRELEARGYRQVALCYFGTARPRIYGIRFADWQTRDEAVAAACDWLAVSATALQGAYGGSSELSRRLEGLSSARAGYSILLYDLKDPRVRAVWDDLRRPTVWGGGTSGPHSRQSPQR
jgi:Dolichyl-phosphate-mannose-protein mannosyltransferase